MIAGFGIGSWYLYMVHDWDGVAGTAYPLMAPWIGLDHLRFGIVGMVASLVAMVVVTLATREPDAEMQAMVEETRDPTGPTIIAAH
jgi:cation/acetate symporter